MVKRGSESWVDENGEGFSYDYQRGKRALLEYDYDRRTRLGHLLEDDVGKSFAKVTVPATHIELGNGVAGLSLSHQGPFPHSTPCVKCGGDTRVVLGFTETGEGGSAVCFSHQNVPRPEKDNEGFWFHDLAAFCLYLCKDIDCATVTTLWNQA